MAWYHKLLNPWYTTEAKDFIDEDDQESDRESCESLSQASNTSNGANILPEEQLNNNSSDAEGTHNDSEAQSEAQSKNLQEKSKECSLDCYR